LSMKLLKSGCLPANALRKLSWEQIDIHLHRGR
jgi:hypothetical protein